MIVLRKIRLFLRREEERCAVTACLLFEQGTQIRRDGEHLVDGAVELRAERRVPRCVGEMAREQAQVASGLRARMRVEGVVRDGVDLALGCGIIHRGEALEGDERVIPVGGRSARGRRAELSPYGAWRNRRCAACPRGRAARDLRGRARARGARCRGGCRGGRRRASPSCRPGCRRRPRAGGRTSARAAARRSRSGSRRRARATRGRRSRSRGSCRPARA